MLFLLFVEIVRYLFMMTGICIGKTNILSLK
jgi:hypothetical protein